MEWVLSHMEDADFNDPLPDTGQAAAAASAGGAAGTAGGQAAADPESVAQLSAMGFTDTQAAAALQVTYAAASSASSSLVVD